MSNQKTVTIVQAQTRTSNANIGTADRPVFLDHAARFWIPKRDKIKLSEDLVYGDKLIASKGSMVDLRYIKNCSTPYVAIQNLVGEQPTDDDFIRVEDGFRTLVNEGLEEGLYQYLKICNYNQSNPNRLKKKHSWFKELNLEKDAKDQVEKESESFEAMNLVFSLYARKSKTYNEEKINYYSTLLKISGKSVSEKYLNLVKLAKTDPKAMMYVIDNSKGDILMVIDKAFKTGILVLGDMVVENTITKQVEITSDKPISRAIAEDKLIQFYAGSGKDSFERIKNAISKKGNVLETA